MKPITIFLAGPGAAPELPEYLKSSGLVEKVCSFNSAHGSRDPRRVSVPGPVTAGASLNSALEQASSKYVLVINNEIVPGHRCLERLLDAAQATGACMVYPDYYLDDGHGLERRELIDYQPGSVREGFDFGSMAMFSAGTPLITIVSKIKPRPAMIIPNDAIISSFIKFSCSWR